MLSTIRSLFFPCVLGFPCVLALTPILAADEAPILFFDQPSFDAGDVPLAHFAADLNQDGNTDIVLYSTVNDTITLVFGNAVGSFGPPVTIDSSTGDSSTGDSSTDVFDLGLGDVNGDGFVDIVASDPNLDKLVTFLGDPTGSFTESISTGVPSLPPNMSELHDLNGDGRQDVILVSSPSLLYLGDALGGFIASGSVPLESSAALFTDINGDGIDDAIDITAAGDIQVYFLDAVGSFTAGPLTAVSTKPNELVSGDWNLDGIQDIALSFSGQQLVSIRLGDGLGGFPTTIDTPVAFSVSALAAAQLDGDGQLDLLISGGTPITSGFLHVALGDGLGGFDLQPRALVSSNTSKLVVEDFNRDGLTDLCVLASNEGAFQVILNDRSGHLELPAEEFIGDIQGMSSADFNGDGRVDPVILTGFSSSNQAEILLSSGDGSFSKSPIALLDLGFPNDIAAGDLDGDGLGDIVAAEGTGVTRAFLQGPGVDPVLDHILSPSGENIDHVILADLDGDAALDIVAVTVDPGSAGNFLILLDGKSTFEVPIPVAGAAPNEPLAVDLDGDGIRDLVVGVGTFGSSNNGLAVHLGDGLGGFDAGTFIPGTDRAGDLAFGDLDGDGDNDLVAAGLTSDALTVWLNDGQAGLTISSEFELEGVLGDTAVAMEDMDGDGDLDVVAVDEFINVFLNDGLGGLALRAQSYASSFLPAESVVADFNDDGLPDVVIGDGVRTAAVIFCQRIEAGAWSSYGSTVNPVGSLVVLGGTADLGSSLTVGVDNPLGTQGAGSLAVVALSFQPAPGYPGGLLVPNYGMAGGSGELLLDLSPGNFIPPFLGGIPWAGSGQPAPIDLDVPVLFDLLGCEIYVQGFLIDPVAAGGVTIGLTQGLQVVLGL